MNEQGQDQGAPPALVVGEDGLHDYPTLQHPTADSLTTLGGDTSQGLQLGGPLGFDELMKSVEFGSVSSGFKLLLHAHCLVI